MHWMKLVADWNAVNDKGIRKDSFYYFPEDPYVALVAVQKESWRP